MLPGAGCLLGADASRPSVPLLVQEYYIRPRVGGGSGFDDRRAAQLKYHLECSIQRRFPKGLKVHVHSRDRRGLLAQITHQLAAHHLTITRAKVMMDGIDSGEGSTRMPRPALQPCRIQWA